MTNKATFNFMDIFKQISSDVIDSYFEKITDLMRNSPSPFCALKIGHRYFKEQKIEASKKAELSIFAEKLE